MDSPTRRTICWRLIALVALPWLPATTISAAEPAKTVALVVDYNDGATKEYKAVPWRDGLTAFDVMTWASQHPHGIKFESKGSGASLIVTSIDGVENEGGGGDAKNWIYSVNDKKGNKSCAVRRLEPGDRVLWKFRVFDD